MFADKKTKVALKKFSGVILKSNYELFCSSSQAYQPNPKNFTTKVGEKSDPVNFGSGRMTNKLFLESMSSHLSNLSREQKLRVSAVKVGSANKLIDDKPDSSGNTSSTQDVKE